MTENPPKLLGSALVRKMARMNNLQRWPIPLALLLLAAAAFAAGSAPTAPGAERPAAVRVEVSPQPVAPGSKAHVTVSLSPAEGVKVNRYPKMKLVVAARPGLVSSAEASVGDDSPPPLDKTGGNYFDPVTPLTLDLAVDKSAKSGAHEVEGQLVFYYCVTKSGFCAPQREPVKIALAVR
jgi:hypothetical protein